MKDVMKAVMKSPVLLALTPLALVLLTACSSSPSSVAQQPTPQIIYVTPAPSEAPTATPDDMPTSRPQTPTPVQPTPEIVYVTPEPVETTDVAESYREFLAEFGKTGLAITAALGAIGEGDFESGLRDGRDAVGEGLAWTRFHTPSPCYAESFDLYHESLLLFDSSFDRTRRSIDTADAAGIDRSTQEMEEATALYVRSGENPDSC